MNACLLCHAKQVVLLLDFGLQPICNRFLARPEEKEATFPMRIGQCKSCGLVQSMNPVPAEELKPRVDWITYNEPEGHLDGLADKIAALRGLTKESVICGVTFKDDSLLKRLRDRGYARTWRMDPHGDLGISDPGVGVETVQDRFNTATSARIAHSRGKADVVIARHIWEHAADPAGFVDALKQLMTPDGYLVLEIPDCERALASHDYSTLWEEHSLYFTPTTFRQSAALCGLSVERYECFPYTLENSLVSVSRLAQQTVPHKLPEALLETEKRRGQEFAAGLPVQQATMNEYFARFRKENGKIALLGAGHLAGTFVNLLQLKEHIDCLVDDNPQKRGSYMPGSGLPIYESGALLDRNIKLCLLSVNAESEDRVIEKNRAFTDAGGIFHSIFPASQYALRIGARK
jgi:hypothetical protein